MRPSLTKRIGRLEEAMMQMQDNYNKPADLSMLSREELEVLQKVLDYTLAGEVAAPTGKRPLVTDPSGLAADDMIVYLGMAEREERRNRHAQSPAAYPQARSKLATGIADGCGLIRRAMTTPRAVGRVLQEGAHGRPRRKTRA
jgi:hypothetical protein